MKPFSRKHNRYALRGPSAQRGATLVVAVIVLMLITMTVISAFRVSKSHTQAVANMQFRDEALAAANLVMEDVISLSNVETLTIEDGTIPARYVDINLDGVDDFRVNLAQPLCVRVEAEATVPQGVNSGLPSSDLFTILWEVQSDVTDTATGATVSVVQGFKQQVGTRPASCPLI